MSDILKPVDHQERIEVNRSADGDQIVRKREVQNHGIERNRMIAKVNAFVMVIMTVLEALFAFRFTLKLLAANPNNVFASFVYAFSDIFLFPFNGLFANPTSNGGNVLEITTLIGMAVYALLTWLIVRLVVIAFRQVSTRDVSVIESG